MDSMGKSMFESSCFKSCFGITMLHKRVFKFISLLFLTYYTNLWSTNDSLVYFNKNYIFNLESNVVLHGQLKTKFWNHALNGWVPSFMQRLLILIYMYSSVGSYFKKSQWEVMPKLCKPGSKSMNEQKSLCHCRVISSFAEVNSQM